MTIDPDDADYGRKVREYHRLYNRAVQRAFGELKRRHRAEFDEILHIERSLIEALQEPIDLSHLRGKPRR